MEMSNSFQYCPPNITDDIWWNYGISHCLYDTISSFALTGFIVIFGLLENIWYRTYATPIEDLSQIPATNLYFIQITLLSMMSLLPFLGYLVELYLFSNAHFYGYTVVTSSLSCLSFILSIQLVWRKRFYSLKVATRNGHGFVLLIFWSLVFINENVLILGVKNREWCFYVFRDVFDSSVIVIRYICIFSIVILGLKAPGIVPNKYEELKGDEDGDKKKRLDWKNGFRIIYRFLYPIWTRNHLGFKVRMVLCFGLLLVGRAINLLIPIYNKKIVDKLSDRVFCWDLILVYIGIKFVQGGGSNTSGIVDNIRQYLWNGIEETAKCDLQVDLYTHLHKLSLRWHLSRKTGEVLRTMYECPNTVIYIVDYVLFGILPSLIDILISITFFTYTIDWYFGLIVLVSMALYIPLVITMDDWQTNVLRRLNDADNDEATQSVDSLLNFETVKYHGAEKYEVEVYRKIRMSYQRENAIYFGTSCIIDTAESFIICSSLLAGSLLCAYLVAEVGSLTPGQYVLFASYILQLYTPISHIGNIYSSLKEYFIGLEKLLDIMEEKPEIIDAPNASELQIAGGRIEFSNVTFGYSSDRVILKNVSFIVPAGHTLAIVGPTGSGKSTIVRLLFRFYDVDSGTISIDGQNIALVTQESLRQAIGVVPQDTVLFNNTIKYNIKYGRLDATDEEIIEAAKEADIHDNILNFSEKYETKVGERGLRLSGGEKQRVAIARTILKSPSIVLLDEATSALDTRTERNIQTALSKACVNRTTIIVAHRLSTVIHANEILVMKDGEIVERGPHEELVNKNAVYADMWNQQLRNEGTGTNADDSKDA